MTTYNTGNPVGSTAVKDIYDNAENFDKALNDTEASTWTDRLGRQRKTYAELERLAKPGTALDAAARAEEAADRAAAYDNLLVYISYDSPSDKRMVDDTSQPVGTLGRVTNDTDPGKNGDWVMTAAGWEWAEVQVASSGAVTYVAGASAKTRSDADLVKGGRNSEAVTVQPGVYNLSTGNPQNTTTKDVRTVGFIYLNAGDRIVVPWYYNVSGVFYAAADASSFTGESFSYALNYTAAKSIFCRLNFLYIGTDPDVNPKNSPTFEHLTIIRNGEVDLRNVPDSGISSSKIDLRAYQSDFPIEPGALQATTGNNLPPTSSFVQRTGYIAVDQGDVFSITDPEYVYNPFFYDANGVFISTPNAWLTADVVINTSGYVRFATKRADNGESINSLRAASWIRGPSAISKWTPNFSGVEDRAIPFSKINAEPFYTRSDFAITDGTISSSTGANGAPNATHVHRTERQAIQIGDELRITDPTYVYSPFFYDASGAFISADGAWHSDTLVSSINGFVRFTTKRVDGSDAIDSEPEATWLEIVRATPLVTEPGQLGEDVVDERSLTPALRGKIDAVGYAQWAGKRWFTLGDSITARGWYQPLVQEMIGAAEFVNYGVGGTTIAMQDEEDTTAMSVRWDDMGTDPDVITVWGGVNDFGYSYGSNGGTDLGTFTDTSPLTFYGALRTIIEGLTTKYPLAKLGFIITTPVSNSNGMRSQNAKGFYLAQYCQAIREVCEYYSIPYVDLYKESGFNQQNMNIMTSNISGSAPDGLHPSQLGMSKISTKIAAFLNSI